MLRHSREVTKKIIKQVTICTIGAIDTVVHTGLLGILDGIEASIDSATVKIDTVHPATTSNPYPDPLADRSEPSESVVTIFSSWDDYGISATGTGFVVNLDGYIMTAGHVVRTRVGMSDGNIGVPRCASSIYVTTVDGKHYEATVVTIDGRADVAILRVVDRRSFAPPPLHIHDAYTTKVGDKITVIGNAFGVDSHSVSEGVIRNPRWKDPRMQNLLTNILTTASTANGCSGAPILDQDGKVVGIHTAAMHPKSVGQAEMTLSPVEEEELPIWIDETGELNIGSMDVVNEVVDNPIAKGSEDDQDARFSTTFGGGLTAPLLSRILARAVQVARGDETVPVLGLDNYVLTKKCMPRFGVVPNTIQNRIRINKKFGSVDLDIYQQDKGYIVVALDDASVGQPRIGDILTHIEGRSVGLDTCDESFGDRTWFLDDGNTVKLNIRRETDTITVYHRVSYLPTVLDIPINDPQFFFFFIALIVAIVVTAVVKNETRKQTGVKIIEEGSYRKLSAWENSRQKRDDAKYLTTKKTVVEFDYEGARRRFTVPINKVFDGDSVKGKVGFENDGCAWVVHDWLYQPPHKCDDGTVIKDHAFVDDLMFDILNLDGFVHQTYAAFLQAFGATGVLEEKQNVLWDETQEKDYIA